MSNVRPDPIVLSCALFCQLADALEVSLDQLLRGQDEPTAIADRFEIKNKQLKELCKKVDQLTPEDQDVICHFLDLAVRSDQVKRLFSRS